jgi:uncharacterized protein YkwD
MIFILFNLLLTFFPSTSINIETIPDEIKIEIVDKVNAVRTKGCLCGNEYYPPTSPIVWNETLHSSALSHARDMARNRFFDHYSSEGLNIGERLDKYGYYWQHAGENIGTGQRSFREVLNDWIKSPTHCKMLMNPNVKDMGVAKYKKFWVQHFGTLMPEGYKRK